MEEFKTFLETSTIHGLGWIASSKRCARFAWLLVVFGGFSCAGYIIYSSFDNWYKNPTTTTIETLPISEITFPNVTICPPKGTSTNFNFDLLKSEKFKLAEITRRKLIEYATDIIQENFYKETLRNIEIVQERKKYYNWYHGHSLLRYPYYNNKKELYFEIKTKSTSGEVTTQYFDEMFDAKKMHGNIRVSIKVYPVEKIKQNRDAVLNFKINKISVEGVTTSFAQKNIDPDLNYFFKNYAVPKLGKAKTIWIEHGRSMTQKDIIGIQIEKMPGFKLRWSYDKEVIQTSTWLEKSSNLDFIRW